MTMDLRVSEQSIGVSYLNGSRERNNLTNCVVVNEGGHQEFVHHAKVCCICDRLISHSSEDWINIKTFENEVVEKVFHKHLVSEMFEHYELPVYTLRYLKQHYTQKFFADNIKLNNMILSPRSYGRQVKTRKELGCCKQCKGEINNMKRKDRQATNPPKFAIVNGLMLGDPPKVLTDLNEVEVALISLARTEKHIFSYHGGHHKSIRGWHTLYANSVSYSNRVLNYFEEQQNAIDEVEDNNFVDIIDHEALDDETESESVDTESSQPISGVQHIAVILSGPFTPYQYAMTRKKTDVDVRNVKKALIWLKKHNILYRDVNVDKDIITPQVIDCHNIVATSGSNIETVFEVTALFPDSNTPSEINGGFQTSNEFKKSTLDRMNTVDSKKEQTVVARSSSTVLRDYVDTNLLKAFPVQFPYGIGNLDWEGNHRCGTSYLKYLSSLSSPNFHVPEFVTIIHNMIERKRLVTSSFLKVSDDEKSSIGELNDSEMQDAINRYLKDKSGYEAADMFIKKLRAITGVMSNSVQSAHLARKRMFSMIAKFGSPSLLFTITPDDNNNFRIKIMSHGKTGSKDPPPMTSSDEILKEFVVDCENIRTSYPGLCAFDFENVLSITIEELLGWNVKEGVNICGKGLFGDLKSWCYAVEEQGRKTLHAHILIWVENWNDLLDGLGDVSRRDQYSTILKQYAAKIMSTKLHTSNDPVCPCIIQPNDMRKCSDQDFRNLRCREGKTSIGEKSILKCCNCGKSFSSNDLACIGIDKTLNNIVDMETESDVFDEGSLWFASSVRDKRRVLMELSLIHKSILEQKTDSISQIESQGYKNSKFITTALRNLHNSDHCTKCFSKDIECRMHVPNRECEQNTITFQSECTPWYTWKGEKKTRNLFIFEGKRSHEDSFVNIHNETASVIFGCNTNVICCVDGGSIMYITAYVSKSTLKDDKKMYVEAAEIMVRKLNERAKLIEEEQLSSIESELEDTGDQDNLLAGIRALIGASLIATKNHYCSAPMASYLIRNHSRFQYSHQFAYANYDEFLKTEIEDHIVYSTEEGMPFLSSKVANYLYRPKKMEKVCLYDSLSLYRVAKNKSNDNGSTADWIRPHPSTDNLKFRKKTRGKGIIPMISYLDFSDTKLYGGKNIKSCDLSECTDSEISAMECNAKVASLLFIPFRCLSDLQDTECN